MRDEVDILPWTLDHLFRQGVDSVFVADHGSVDGTAEILEEYAERLPVVVYSDQEPGHYQAEKITLLAHLARQRGARWVLPFDADEFWFAGTRSLAEELTDQGAPIRTAKLFNVFPHPDEHATPLEAGRLDLCPHPRVKVAFRSARFMHVADGNHDVERRGDRADGLFVAHLPWRSFEQFKRKVRQGGAALAVTDLGAHKGYHWRYLAALRDDQLLEAWEEILRGDSQRPIEWSPVGPFVEADILGARTWADVPA